MINISFPGGAGGNWLLNLLRNESFTDNSVHFHKHEQLVFNKHKYAEIKKYAVKISHELDTTKFDYLLSGKSYFNFYLNVIYKHFYHDFNIFNQTNYKTYFLECVNTARFLCKFDQIYNHVYFDYDDLIDKPKNFYTQLYKFQIKNSRDLISEEDFLLRRNRYINTCVNPSTIKQNFDNMFWVCFVIGQLMNLNLTPQDFLIYEYQNQDRCKQFALDNYQQCTLNKIHDINTTIFMPNLL